MALTLRYGQPRDLLGLMALEQATFGADCFDRQMIQELLTQDRCTVFVASEPGRLLGVVYLLWKSGPAGDYGRVFSLAVEPKAQGQKIGAQLMALAEAEAQLRGANRLVLEVRQENLSAIGFYRKLSYRQTRQKPSFYPDGAGALCLRKLLAPVPRPYRPEWVAPQGLTALVRGSLPAQLSPLSLANQVRALGLEVRLICPHQHQGAKLLDREAEPEALAQAFAQGLGWAGYRFTGADLEVGRARFAEQWLFFSPAGKRSPPSWWRLLELNASGMSLEPLGPIAPRPLVLAPAVAFERLRPKNRSYRALLLVGPLGSMEATSTGLR